MTTKRNGATVSRQFRKAWSAPTHNRPARVRWIATMRGFHENRTSGNRVPVRLRKPARGCADERGRANGMRCCRAVRQRWSAWPAPIRVTRSTTATLTATWFPTTSRPATAPILPILPITKTPTKVAPPTTSSARSTPTMGWRPAILTTPATMPATPTAMAWSTTPSYVRARIR